MEFSPQAHGVRDLGPAAGRSIDFTDVHCSPDPDCDEGRRPRDYLGAEAWDVTRG
jgi:hypothetical protein